MQTGRTYLKECLYSLGNWWFNHLPSSANLTCCSRAALRKKGHNLNTTTETAELEAAAVGLTAPATDTEAAAPPRYKIVSFTIRAIIFAGTGVLFFISSYEGSHKFGETPAAILGRCAVGFFNGLNNAYQIANADWPGAVKFALTLTIMPFIVPFTAYLANATGPFEKTFLPNISMIPVTYFMASGLLKNLSAFIQTCPIVFKQWKETSEYNRALYAFLNPETVRLLETQKAEQLPLPEPTYTITWTDAALKMLHLGSAGLLGLFLGPDNIAAAENKHNILMNFMRKAYGNSIFIDKEINTIASCVFSAFAYSHLVADTFAKFTKHVKDLEHLKIESTPCIVHSSRVFGVVCVVSSAAGTAYGLFNTKKHDKAFWIAGVGGLFSSYATNYGSACEVFHKVVLTASSWRQQRAAENPEPPAAIGSL